MGYSTEGEMGYNIYVPELKEIVSGVNCLFNEVIPTYREEYFYELNKMNFEFEITRVVNLKGLIVGYRAPALRNRNLGVEEKSPVAVEIFSSPAFLLDSSWSFGPSACKSNLTCLFLEHASLLLIGVLLRLYRRLGR